MTDRPDDRTPSSEPPQERRTGGPGAFDRRRRLQQIFGDPLPETTGDDRDDDEGPDEGETWLRDNVPPHHG